MSLTYRCFPITRRATTRLSVITSHLSASSSSYPRYQPSAHIRKMSSAPSTMKAVLVDKVGGPDVLRFDEKYPVPQLKDNQVLVKNEIAGINYIDTYFRTGLYPSATGYPLIVGQEAVGKIVATKGSNLHGLKEGDTVVWMAQGSYAEYTAVPAARAVAIPFSLTSQKENVIGSFLMGMTALTLTQESYPVKKGDTILVHAAAGGVGLLLCQILRDLGATVIGTASTAEKCELAKKNGADHMINYKEHEDWVSELKKIVPEGVDCVYDSVGKTTWEGSLDASKRKGTVIYFGNASGPIPPIQVQRLAQKNTKIMRATLMQYIVTREEMEHYSGLLFEYLNSGKLKVKINHTYDLSEMQQAHKDIEGRGTTGKSLIKL